MSETNCSLEKHGFKLHAEDPTLQKNSDNIMPKLDYSFKQVVLCANHKQIPALTRNSKEETVLLQWLNKTFPSLLFVPQFSPEWSRAENGKKKRYDVGSYVAPIVIESDGKNHFRRFKHFAGFMTNENKQEQSKDMYKNRIAVLNGYNIIRIHQEDLNNLQTWKHTLKEIINKILNDKISSCFFYINTKTDCVMNAFKLQEEDLERLNIEQAQLKKTSTIEENGISVNTENKQTFSLKKIVDEMYSELNQAFPDEFKRYFNAKWLGKKRFQLGSNKHKIVIPIDYTFFINLFDNEPAQSRKEEMEKCILAYKNGYKIVRCYYELDKKNDWKTLFMNTIREVVEDTNKEVFLYTLDTGVDDYNEIYKTFTEQFKESITQLK